MWRWWWCISGGLNITHFFSHHIAATKNHVWTMYGGRNLDFQYVIRVLETVLYGTGSGSMPNTRRAHNTENIMCSTYIRQRFHFSWNKARSVNIRGLIEILFPGILFFSNFWDPIATIFFCSSLISLNWNGLKAFACAISMHLLSVFPEAKLVTVFVWLFIYSVLSKYYVYMDLFLYYFLFFFLFIFELNACMMHTRL